MIIAIIYIFLSDVIFDQQLKITFRKSSALSPPPVKIHSSLKIQKLQVPSRFCQNRIFFRPPPAERVYIGR